MRPGRSTARNLVLQAGEQRGQGGFGRLVHGEEAREQSGEAARERGAILGVERVGDDLEGRFFHCL